jgi:GNAT superfamily N-acetyltransferase
MAFNDRMPHDEVLIETPDPTDGHIAEALASCYAAVMREIAPDDPSPGTVRMREHVQPPYHGCTRVRVARDAGGDTLGYVVLFTEDDTNRSLAYGDLFVRPDARRRGIGRTLYADAIELARASGRDTLVFDGLADTERDGASHAFALAVGAKPVLAFQRNILDVASVDAECVAELSQGTGQPAGYRLVRWQGHCPDELVASMSTASASIYDAPFGNLELERASAPIARIREREKTTLALGIRRYSIAAVVEETNEIVGYSTTLVYPDSTLAEQGDTLVVAAHRGRRIGLWLKSELLLWLLREERDVTMIQTENAVANDHMLAINRTIGWRPAERWCAYQRSI